MIRNIIESISIALNTEFGEEVTIYAEQKKQGMKEPCFFIFCINSSSELFVGHRYFCNNLFCIHYFPKTERNANMESHNIAERMRSCLEYIGIKNELIRGKKMNHKIVDGVLNFFVTYDMFTYQPEEKETMSEHVINNKTKG